MPLFHYSHFCRILRQKKKEEKMSNVCFLPFANSSVHKVSGNNGSGNYIRHFHKFFISKLWAAEADALLSLLPKKEKRATKITPRREKSHISMWVHHKYQRNDSETVVLRWKGQIVLLQLHRPSEWNPTTRKYIITEQIRSKDCTYFCEIR